MKVAPADVHAVQELEKGDDDIVTVDMHDGSVYVDEPKQKVDLTKFTDRHKFVFDDSLDHNVSNDVVYSHTVQPLVHTIFKAGKATCFAYGQTGSGKTYTMSPLPPRAASEILTLLGTTSFSEMGLFVSCFEIYGNKVRDQPYLISQGRPDLMHPDRDHLQLHRLHNSLRMGYRFMTC
jgi:kinesin family member 2/24